MKTSLLMTSWHGLDAIALENDRLRIVTVPELGAKLASLFDKRSQREWLVGPGERQVRRVDYGAPFVEQDLSGWDEMFPTIVACAYPAPGEWYGAVLPDHGEVWSLPWMVEQSGSGKLTLSVEGRALPYRLRRTLEFPVPDSFSMVYSLANLGRERLAYIWAAHPQFVCEDGAEIILPSQVSKVCNTLPADWGWGEPETCFNWPLATSVSGQPVRIDRVGPASRKQGRKFFLLPEERASWVGLLRYPGRDWLRMQWNPDQVPYFGLWVDEGALSHTAVAAPEPTTGFYDSLGVAYQKNQVTLIEPGAVRNWTLTVQLGVGAPPFPVSG